MLDWVEHDGGWSAGRYEVRRGAGAGWELLSSQRPAGGYRRASAARAAAGRMERLRRRRRGILWRLAALALAAGAAALVFAFRMGDDPAHAAALDLAARIDAAYLAVEGGAPIESISDPSFTAAVVPLPTGGEVYMMTGEAGGDCYSFYWNDVRGPVARLLVGTLPCEPSAVSVQSGHHVYHRQTPAASGHLPVFGGAFDWAGVLPPEQRQQPWAMPLLLVLGTTGLFLLVGISRLLLGVDPGGKIADVGAALPETAA